MLREFILTVYTLVLAKRFDELHEYFSLIRDLLNAPQAVITPGAPKDKQFN